MAEHPQKPESDPTRALIIVADDGNIYKIEESEYKARRIPEAESGIVRQLVKWGASYGFMPTTGPGIGSACYLVNLRSLRTRAPDLPTPIEDDPLRGPGGGGGPHASSAGLGAGVDDRKR